MGLPSVFENNNKMSKQPAQPKPKKAGCKISTKTDGNGKSVKEIQGSCSKQELEALKNQGQTDSPDIE